MHVNSKQKKAGVATHIKETIDIKSKIVSIEKEGLYILIKESLQQKDIKIIYMHTASEHIKTLPANTGIKEKIDCIKCS